MDWDALGAELKEYLNQTATQTPQATSDQPFSEGLVWDALKQCCARQGMTKAAEELQKIFPLFVETDEREKEDE